MYLDRFGFRLWSKWKPTSGAFFEARGTSVSSMTRYQTGGAKWVTKPLSVIRAPRRSSRKVRAEQFGTAWAGRVSQAQRGVGIGVSMGRDRRTSNTLQLRALPTRRARFAGAPSP